MKKLTDALVALISRMCMRYVTVTSRYNYLQGFGHEKGISPCPCGDRPAAYCPGEWEQGCDLGANELYVARHEHDAGVPGLYVSTLIDLRLQPDGSYINLVTGKPVPTANWWVPETRTHRCQCGCGQLYAVRVEHDWLAPGLYVSNNLRVVLAEDNLRKHNKLPEEVET